MQCAREVYMLHSLHVEVRGSLLGVGSCIPVGSGDKLRVPDLHGKQCYKLNHFANPTYGDFFMGKDSECPFIDTTIHLGFPSK